jgi:hypothetical protein
MFDPGYKSLFKPGVTNDGSLHPAQAHWTSFFRYAPDADFVTQTGFDRRAFQDLLVVFDRHYWRRRASLRFLGRPRKLGHQADI